MAWIVLIISGAMEAVWAAALGLSEGLSRPVPTVVFIVSLVASMAGLSFAVGTLPTGTAYAIWVGIGAAGTVGYSMASGAEEASIAKVLLLFCLIGCVIGLKLVHEG